MFAITTAGQSLEAQSEAGGTDREKPTSDGQGTASGADIRLLKGG